MSALPTGDELKALPLRAVVAYAHRCAARAARRCLPAANGPGMPSTFGCGEAVRRALRPAAKVAAGEAVSRRDLTAAEDVIVATVARLGRGETDASGATCPDPSADGNRSDPAGRAVAMTANAAYAALAAASAVADETSGGRSIRGHRAVLSAVTAAEAAAGACPAIRIGMRRDFGLLSRLNLGAFPDPGRGVDVSDGGPLGDLGKDGRRRDETFDLDHADAELDEAELDDTELDEAALDDAESDHAESDAAELVEEPAGPAASPPASPAVSPLDANAKEPARIAMEEPVAPRLAPELLSPSSSPSPRDPFGLGAALSAVTTDPFAVPAAVADWSPALPSSSGEIEPGESVPGVQAAAGGAAAGGAAARSSAALARREAALSTRDAALCTREAALAEREATFADREADLADREADLSDRTAAAEHATRTAAGELAAARADRQELTDAAAALRRVCEQHPVLTGAVPAGAVPAGAVPAGAVRSIEAAQIA